MERITSWCSFRLLLYKIGGFVYPSCLSSLVFRVFFSRQLESVCGECLLVSAARNWKEQATRGYCNLSSVKTPLSLINGHDHVQLTNNPVPVLPVNYIFFSKTLLFTLSKLQI